MMLAGKTNRYESDTSELGLALAYDIVKAHGGEIRVETKEGEGSEFIVQLPIQWDISYV